MANANINSVLTTNTFDDWRVATNDLIKDRNLLRNYSYVKDNADFTLANGAVSISRSTGGTLLSVIGASSDALIGGKTTTTTLVVTTLANVNQQNTVTTMEVGGNTSLYSNLAVSKNTVMSQNANVIGTLNVGSLLQVTGNAFLYANVTVSKNANISGTLNVGSESWIGGNLVMAATRNITTPNLVVTTKGTMTDLLVTGTLTLTNPISGPAVTDASSYTLRYYQTTLGDGSFGINKGGANGNAYLTFATASNTWQMTANNLIPTTNGYTTILGVSNVSDSVATTSSVNVASLTAVKTAYDTAVAAYGAANSAANSAMVSANSTSTLNAQKLNFVNTATINVSVGAGASGNANIAFSVNSSAVSVGGGGGAQGVQGAQGTQGTQGLQGLQGVQGVQGFGIQGTQGNKGGLIYSFSTIVSDTDPGAGTLKYNSTSIGSVGFIYVSNTSASVDVSAFLTQLGDSTNPSNTAYMIIEDVSNSGTVINIWRVTGPTTGATGYTKIPVALVSGSTLPTGLTVAVQSSRTGDRGIQGTTGPIAGSSGQFAYNNGGAAAGAVGLTYDVTNSTVDIIKYRRPIANLISGTVSGAVAVDLTAASFFKYTVSGAPSFTFNNAPGSTANAYQFSVMVTQNGTGGYTPTFSNTVKWSGGTQPTPTTTPNANDIWSFVTFDGSTYYGTLAMKDAK
jgi:hypothetical protein